MLDHESNECKFFLKSRNRREFIEKNNAGEQEKVTKIKKVIQKKDENGNPIFEIKEVKVRRGCRCKGKNREEKIVKKRVPVTEEVWVEKRVPVNNKLKRKDINTDNDNKLIICKMYGKVKKEFCKNCSTFKKKK